jgi:hypothetical protein
MSHRLNLFVFVDALGWEITEWSQAFPELSVERRPLETQFGYSSACLPTILSGAEPHAHGHWNQYYRPAERETFSGFRWLRHLPGELRVPSRLQGPLNRWIKRKVGLEGYFALHQMPLQRLHDFDVCEHENLFAPGALPRTGSVIDDVHASALEAHVSDWRVPESARWEALHGALRGRRRLDWAFLYLAELDGLLHHNGWPAPEPRAKIAADAVKLQALVREAEQLGYDVQVALFSDHGMANCRQTLDLRSIVRRRLSLREGRDYQAFYDSTMARFWSEEPTVLARLDAALDGLPGVRLLDRATLERWGVYFADGAFGQRVAVVDPGTLIIPSDMGRRPICGMHGYAPDDPDSAAALLTNYELPAPARHLRDLRRLMSAPLRAARAA